jgi:hypothetical protein
MLHGDAVDPYRLTPDLHSNRTSTVLRKDTSGNPTEQELTHRCKGRLLALRGFYRGLRISSPAHHVTWHMVPVHFGAPQRQGQEQ